MFQGEVFVAGGLRVQESLQVLLPDVAEQSVLNVIKLFFQSSEGVLIGRWFPSLLNQYSFHRLAKGFGLGPFAGLSVSNPHTFLQAQCKLPILQYLVGFGGIGNLARIEAEESGAEILLAGF